MSLGTFGWRRATADGTAIATAAMIIPSMRVDGCIGKAPSEHAAINADFKTRVIIVPSPLIHWCSRSPTL
jgi:hypothetical protein